MQASICGEWSTYSKFLPVVAGYNIDSFSLQSGPTINT